MGINEAVTYHEGAAGGRELSEEARGGGGCAARMRAAPSSPPSSGQLQFCREYSCVSTSLWAFYSAIWVSGDRVLVGYIQFTVCVFFVHGENVRNANG